MPTASVESASFLTKLAHYYSNSPPAASLVPRPATPAANSCRPKESSVQCHEPEEDKEDGTDVSHNLFITIVTIIMYIVHVVV